MDRFRSLPCPWLLFNFIRPLRLLWGLVAFEPRPLTAKFPISPVPNQCFGLGKGGKYFVELPLMTRMHAHLSHCAPLDSSLCLCERNAADPWPAPCCRPGIAKHGICSDNYGVIVFLSRHADTACVCLCVRVSCVCYVCVCVFEKTIVCLCCIFLHPKVFSCRGATLLYSTLLYCTCQHMMMSATRQNGSTAWSVIEGVGLEMRF